MYYKLILLLTFISIPIINSYSQNAEELYTRAKKYHHVLNKKDMETAISLLEKSVQLDENFIEAHLKLADCYCWNFAKAGKNKAKYHFERCIALLEKGLKPKGIDSLTERNIYRRLADAYRSVFELNKNRDNNNFEKAIELYKKALEYPYISKQLELSSKPDLCSDKEIKKSIIDCFIDLAGNKKELKDYFYSGLHLYDAMFSYPEVLTEDEFRSIDRAMKINYFLLQNENWQVFPATTSSETNTNIYYPQELISNKGFLFFYNKENLEKLPNKIIRIWILTENLTDKDSLNANDLYEGKTLAEFDLKNKKCKVIKLITYTKNNEVLNNETYEESKWDYVIPDSIYDSILNYLIKHIDNI